METENEIYSIKGYDYDVSFWSHHHNPRTVANNPAGEIALNFGITGPALHHRCRLCRRKRRNHSRGSDATPGECDLAVVGGVSESIHTFGIFASFKSQGALSSHPDPTKASRPLTLIEMVSLSPRVRASTFWSGYPMQSERGEHLAEIVSYAINTDAPDFVLPNLSGRRSASKWRSSSRVLSPDQIQIVSTHATGTNSGDPRKSKR